MLFYLFSAEELARAARPARLPLDRGPIPRTVDYYLRRTSHGSTLSQLVHAWVLARSDRRQAWQLLPARRSHSDVADVQGGTTGEGIHLGAMAGTVDLLQRGSPAWRPARTCCGSTPCLPDALTGLTFRLRYRQHPDVELSVTHGSLRIGGTGDGATVLPVRVREDDFSVDPRGTLVVALRRPANGGR